MNGSKVDSDVSWVTVDWRRTALIWNKMAEPGRMRVRVSWSLKGLMVWLSNSLISFITNSFIADSVTSLTWPVVPIFDQIITRPFADNLSNSSSFTLGKAYSDMGMPFRVSFVYMRVRRRVCGRRLQVAGLRIDWETMCLCLTMLLELSQSCLIFMSSMLSGITNS